MKVFIVYVIIIVFIILIFIMTSRYKRKVFQELDRKKHRLKFCYGMSAFILDFINTHVYTINYDTIKVKLSRIYVKKADETEAYLHVVSKVSLSIIVFMIIAAAGCLKCAENIFSNHDKVVYIERPEYGNGEKRYHLMAGYEDGSHERVDIILSERKFTENEIMQMFTDSYDELVEKFLGNNDELGNITDSVNLIHKVGNEISVDWDISGTEFIDYYGDIKWENITGQAKTEIKVKLSFEDYSQDYTLPLILNKEGRNEKSRIHNELSTLIDSSSEYDKKIMLPEYVAGHKVNFFYKKEKDTLLYLFIAFAAAVILFVVKEKDTDKKLEERKSQLEADYAQIVNKLTVLQGSGMTLLSAWDKIITDYERNSEKKIRFAYEEMKYARNRMKAGYSETASYLEFGRRCGTHTYIKFANLLEQNIKKGTKGLKDILNAEARDALEERKALARKKGDEAGTKLLLPMGIMLIISIIMIIVPALMSISI